MTEETEASTDATPQTDSASPAEAITTATPATEGKPAGYSPVDLSALPDDLRKPVEERLNYMYKQIKTNQKVLGEYKGIAKTQSEKINELMNGMGQVVDHLHTRSIAEEEANTRLALKQAHESGDSDAFLAANEKLADIKAQKAAIKNQPKQQPQQKQNQNQNYRSAAEIADDAVADGDMDPVMATAVKTWQGETDERGAPLRPWAQSRTPDDPLKDPLYRRAYLESAVVFDEDGQFAHLTTEQKLAEVDRRMGVARNTGGQTVMGGGQLTNGRKSVKISITPKQQEIATRLKFGGPKAKSDADHIEAYRKQIEIVNAKRGAKQ